MQCLATLTILQDAFNNDAAQARLLVSHSSSPADSRAKDDPTEIKTTEASSAQAKFWLVPRQRARRRVTRGVSSLYDGVFRSLPSSWYLFASMASGST